MTRLFFVFLLSGCAEDRGAIEISWALPSDRADGCQGDPDIATIRASVFEGSIARSQEIECRVGQTILIPDVSPGSYSLVVDALTIDDTRIFSQTVSGLQVDEGKTQTQFVALEPLPGTVRVSWTLPTDCATDSVRDVRMVVYSEDALVVDDAAQPTPCEDGEKLLEGSWIVTADYPVQRLFVYGRNSGGTETHELAICDLVVESIVETQVDAPLAACAGADCCAGDCATHENVLCPLE